MRRASVLLALCLFGCTPGASRPGGLAGGLGAVLSGLAGGGPSEAGAEAGPVAVLGASSRTKPLRHSARATSRAPSRRRRPLFRRQGARPLPAQATAPTPLAVRRSWGARGPISSSRSAASTTRSAGACARTGRADSRRLSRVDCPATPPAMSSTGRSLVVERACGGGGCPRTASRPTPMPLPCGRPSPPLEDGGPRPCGIAAGRIASGEGQRGRKGIGLAIRRAQAGHPRRSGPSASSKGTQPPRSAGPVRAERTTPRGPGPPRRARRAQAPRSASRSARPPPLRRALRGR